MTKAPPDEQPFPSTTWAWKRTKIRTPPAGQTTARAKRGRWYGLATWPRSRPLTVTISYRGGAESWWLVQARGRNGVFPGHAAIEDVMAAVNNEWNGPVWMVTSPDSKEAYREVKRRTVAGESEHT